LAACAVLTILKAAPWPPAMMGFALAAAAALPLAIVRARRKGLPAGRMRYVPLAVVWLAWLVAAAEWHLAAHSSQKAAGTGPIVLMGDSLTAGLAPVGGYAPELRRLAAVDVVDLSREGITCREALRSLPAMVAARPQVVVVELGGNDYVRGRARSETAAELTRLITAAHQAGADVVLVEVPRGFVFDPYRGLERELARRHDLELVSDTVVRELVLFNPYAPPGMWLKGGHLSDDGLHPNSAGNRRLAEAVAAALVRIGAAPPSESLP
jgi:lysophospholipase L1-like esterase